MSADDDTNIRSLRPVDPISETRFALCKLQTLAGALAELQRYCDLIRHARDTDFENAGDRIFEEIGEALMTRAFRAAEPLLDVVDLLAEATGVEPDIDALTAAQKAFLEG